MRFVREALLLPAIAGLLAAAPVARADGTRPVAIIDPVYAKASQRAAYFRRISNGQSYGVSAFAIGTGSSKEEFPAFTNLWVLEPAVGDDTPHVIALSQSSSAAAVYRLALRPGSDAIIDVSGEIDPRIDVSEIGVAPLPSMYLHSPADPRPNEGKAGENKRPEVHDSLGLKAVGPARVAPVGGSTTLRRFTLEFAGDTHISEGALKPELWATAGRLSSISVLRNASGMAQLSLDLDPGTAPVIGLHAALAGRSSQLSETWLFRWTPD